MIGYIYNMMRMNFTRYVANDVLLCRQRIRLADILERNTKHSLNILKWQPVELVLCRRPSSAFRVHVRNYLIRERLMSANDQRQCQYNNYARLHFYS